MAAIRSLAANQASPAPRSPQCIAGPGFSTQTSDTVLKGLVLGNRGGLKSWWSCEDVSAFKLGNLDGFMVSPVLGEDNFKSISATQYQAMLPALRAATQVIASKDSLAYLHSLCFGSRTHGFYAEGTEDEEETEDEWDFITFMDSTEGELTPQQTLDANTILAHVAKYLTISFSPEVEGSKTEQDIFVPVANLEGYGSNIFIASSYLQQVDSIAKARSEGRTVDEAMEVAVQFQLMCALLCAIPHAVDFAIRFAPSTSALFYKDEIIANVGLSWINHVLGGVPVLARRQKKLGCSQQYCHASKLTRGSTIAESVCDIGGAVAFSNFGILTECCNTWLQHGNDLTPRGRFIDTLGSGFLDFHTRVPMAHVASFFNADFWNDESSSLKVEPSAHAPVGYTAAFRDTNNINCDFNNHW